MRKLKKLLAFLLIICSFSISVGIRNFFITKTYAADVDSKVKNLMQNSQTVQTIKNSTVVKKAQDFFEKWIFSNKKMSKLEKIFWSVVDAIFPTIMVILSGIALAALGISGLGIVIVVAMIVAFASKAIIVYLKTRREDHFKGTRTDNKILLRKILVQSTKEALMAPLSAIGGGIAVNVGREITLKVVASNALKLGALNFVGSEIASVGSGMVKNIYNDKVLHLDKKLKKLENRQKVLLEKLNKGTISEAELDELKKLNDEIEKIRHKEYYSAKDLAKDTVSNFVGSLFTGVVGNLAGFAVSKYSAAHLIGSESMNLQKIAAKMMGDPAKAKDLANLAVNPITSGFSSGVNAVVQNAIFYDKEIVRYKRAMEEAKKKGDLKKASYYEYLYNKALKQRKKIREEVKKGMINGFYGSLTSVVINTGQYQLFDKRKAKSKIVSDLAKKDGIDDVNKLSKEQLKAYEERANKIMEKANELKIAQIAGNKEKIIKTYGELLQAKGEIPANLPKEEFMKLAQEKYQETLNSAYEKAMKKVADLDKAKLELETIDNEILKLRKQRAELEEKMKNGNWKDPNLQKQYKLVNNKISLLTTKKYKLAATVSPASYTKEVYNLKVAKWVKEHPGQKIPDNLADKFYEEAMKASRAKFGDNYFKYLIQSNYMNKYAKAGDLAKVVGDNPEDFSVTKAIKNALLKAKQDFIKKYRSKVEGEVKKEVVNKDKLKKIGDEVLETVKGDDEEKEN